MSRMQRWLQSDMSGGENQSAKPDLIAENQVVEMVNILPRQTTIGYELRTGFKSNGSYGNVGSPFVKTDTQGRDLVLAIDSPGTTSSAVKCYWDLKSAAETIYDAKDLSKVYWSDWDGNKFMFSNAEIGLHVMSAEQVNGTNRATRVIDCGDGSVELSKAPNLKYLTQHKGRLFGVGISGNGSWCTVHSSGSSDLKVPRYQSWTGLSASSGGSFDAVPYGSDVTGLASTYNGLVVFKEDRILMLSYPDTSAPWDTSTGASLDVISDGVGCVSHDSIDVYQDIIYFVGRINGGKLCVYSLSGGQVTMISDNINDRMKSIINSNGSAVEGVVVDDYYILFARDSKRDGKQAVACMDIRTGAWSRFEGIQTSGVTRMPLRGVLTASKTGFYSYPSPTYLDGNERLRWRLTTRRLISDSPDSDAYWRLFGGRGGSANIESFSIYAIDDNNESHQLRSIQYGYLADSWNDGSLWNDDTVWQLVYDESANVYEFDAWNNGSPWNDDSVWTKQPVHFEFFTDVDLRSNGLQFVMEGEAKSNVYFDFISAGYRDRRQRNDRYA